MLSTTINSPHMLHLYMWYIKQCCIHLLVGMFPHSIYFSAQVQLLGPLPTLVRELEPFFLTMYSVQALRPDWWTVLVTHLAFITVPTLKMLESPVKVSNETVYINTIYITVHLRSTVLCIHHMLKWFSVSSHLLKLYTYINTISVTVHLVLYCTSVKEAALL